MSKYTIYTVFDVQSNDNLRNIIYIHRFIDAAATKGFYYSEDIHSREEFNIDSAIEVVTKNRYQVIEKHMVSERLSFKNDNFYSSISIDAVNWNLFLVTISSAYFAGSKTDRLLKFRQFVMLCEIAYNIFSPDYGYGLTTPEIRPIESSNLQFVPSTVFDLNFFGPSFVQRLGEQKLSICPSWKTVIFNDGGMMLQMSEDPVGRPGDFRDNYIETAKILGVDKTQIGM